jgi:hypothetical protein
MNSNYNQDWIFYSSLKELQVNIEKTNVKLKRLVT